MRGARNGGRRRNNNSNNSAAATPSWSLSSPARAFQRYQAGIEAGQRDALKASESTFRHHSRVQWRHDKQENQQAFLWRGRSKKNGLMVAPGRLRWRAAGRQCMVSALPSRARVSAGNEHFSVVA